MVDNNKLRKEVRLLKALNEVSYGEVAEMIGLSRSSFSNWLNGNYDFGEQRTAQLEELIQDLKGE